MAKVELPAGIKSISGRIGNVVYRTLPNGKIIATRYQKRERTTPVSDAERKARRIFADAAKDWLSQNDTYRAFIQRNYNACKGMYHGKHYNTVRGFFIAMRIQILKEMRFEDDEEKEEEE